MNKKIFLFAQVLSFVAFLVLLGCIIFGVVARDILAEGSIMLAVFLGAVHFY